MPSGKREAASYHLLKATAAAQPEEIRTRRTYAEKAGAQLLGRLGAPGTYETPATQSALLKEQAEPAPGETAPAEGGGIFKTDKAQSFAANAIDQRYTSKDAIQDITHLDPEEFTKAQEGTAQFRIMSRLTAEAEQLVAREGPLYNEMLNNLQLPIIEGAAAMARENTENLRKAMRRGGSARRTAMEAVLKQREQMRQNSDTMQRVSNVRASLDQWSRQNAMDVVKAGQDWAQNSFGIRESYQNAMDGASQLMLTSALPLMFEGTEKAAEWRYYAHAKNRAKVGQWVQGVMGVVSMAAGIAGGMGLQGLQVGIGGLEATIPMPTGEAASTAAQWGASAITAAGTGVRSPAEAYNIPRRES